MTSFTKRAHGSTIAHILLDVPRNWKRMLIWLIGGKGLSLLFFRALSCGGGGGSSLRVGAGDILYGDKGEPSLPSNELPYSLKRALMMSCREEGGILRLC